jgi:hypothetical protein
MSKNIRIKASTKLTSESFTLEILKTTKLTIKSPTSIRVSYVSMAAKDHMIKHKSLVAPVNWWIGDRLSI